MLLLAIYIALFVLAYTLYGQFTKRKHLKQSYTERKTVTFGDASAVRPNRVASVISIITLFLLWGMFTGSKLVPVHVPGPFIGDTSFTYTATNQQNQTDDGTVFIRVSPAGSASEKPTIPDQDNNGFVKDDALQVTVWRSKLIRVQNNDQGGKEKGYRINAVNGQIIAPKQSVNVDDGVVTMMAW